MAIKWTHTAAFHFYNTEPRNANWSWSARSTDGLTVAVTLWKHELIGPAGKLIYHRHEFGDWHKGLGSRFFFEDLAWALAHCDGIIRVVVAVRDWAAGARVRTLESYPQKNLIMRVTHLDPERGSFRLEQVLPRVGQSIPGQKSDSPTIGDPFVKSRFFDASS